ncbi:hypothetical protein GOEFS_081_00520 [Gordonia effusa NBRC 100432]|uniref:Uncharacterized protein n=1 Tax=Gordonia effusa NBRC 100432 TaxID=1077974 RepID=H0R2R1_9ACTN|nr:hypothetical protein [Gordonia effusa]GAB19362.1 hypothetical protein GOEFS_081_00520 [Gordonia effusa NBRC 100432]
MTQERDQSGSGTSGDSSDLMREVLLGLAAQIDNLAGLFAGSPDLVGAGVAGHDLAGDISALLGEIGELLARLIATLIAVLEAIAKALRGSSANVGAGAPQQYQSIAVRIDRSVATD